MAYSEFDAQSWRNSELNRHLAGIEREDRIADAIDARLDALRTNRPAIAIADEGWTGTLGLDQYSAIESALADLDGIHPSDLHGSDVLATLYRLAAVCAGLREKELRLLAEEQVESDMGDADIAAAEAYMDAKADRLQGTWDVWT